MLTVVIGLICFAVAFVVGGVLSKVYFTTQGSSAPVDRAKLHALLQAQRVRYRKRMIALNNVIRRHEDTRDQVRGKLADIELKHVARGKQLCVMKDELKTSRKQLANRERRIAELDADESSTSALEKEIGMLRIEKDELTARIKRMEAELIDDAATAETAEFENEIARMRADMGELREMLATRDRRVHDLELQLTDSTARVRQLQAKLDSWKQRVTPLTRKLKQQKEVIRKYCEENGAERHPEEPDDDLKAIRGIGPALERRLQQHGIRRYQQIANMTHEELTDISQKLAIAPTLAERDAWIQQARELQGQTALRQTA